MMHQNIQKSNASRRAATYHRTWPVLRFYGPSPLRGLPPLPVSGAVVMADQLQHLDRMFRWPYLTLRAPSRWRLPLSPGCRIGFALLDSHNREHSRGRRNPDLPVSESSLCRGRRGVRLRRAPRPSSTAAHSSLVSGMEASWVLISCRSYWASHIVTLSSHPNPTITPWPAPPGDVGPPPRSHQERWLTQWPASRDYQGVGSKSSTAAASLAAPAVDQEDSVTRPVNRDNVPSDDAEILPSLRTAALYERLQSDEVSAVLRPLETVPDNFDVRRALTMRQVKLDRFVVGISNVYRIAKRDLRSMRPRVAGCAVRSVSDLAHPVRTLLGEHGINRSDQVESSDYWE